MQLARRHLDPEINSPRKLSALAPKGAQDSSGGGRHCIHVALAVRIWL